MINQEGKIYYGLGLDNEQLQADANQSMAIIRGIGDSSVAEGARIDNAYKKIAGTVATVFTIQKAAEFAKAIVQVRGEIESLEISFETLLGSKEKADALFSQIRRFASDTPMELGDLAKGAQTLLSFNIEAEKVMPIIRQIGDISMGESQKFNSLVLAFAQMSSTGKLMGQDLLQMINAGFNPLSVISEKTGKSISQLKDDMSAGAITVDMVADAFASAASEGGQFYGMLEKQSKGINGSISNLKGAIDDMFNDLGTKSQGFITAAIGGATTLVKHYETIGEILAVIVATYGTYKAAIIATEAVRQSLNTVRYAEEASQLTALLTVEQQARISKLGLTEGSIQHSAAVKAEVASNIQAAQATLAKARTEVSAASQVVAARRAEYIAAKQLDQQRLAELMSIGATGTAKQIEVAQRRLAAAEAQKESAALAFQNATRDFSSKKLAVETAAKQANTITTAANTAAQTANVTATSILTAAKLKLTAIAAKLNAVIMANPYMLAAAAVVALAYGIYKLVTYQTEAEKAQKKLNDTIKETEKSLQSERYQIDLMFTRLKAAKEGTEEYAAAKKAIINQYGDYLKKLGDEKTALNDIAAAYALITEEATKSARARAMQKITSEAGDIVSEKQSDVYDDVRKYLKKQLKGKKGGNGEIDLADEYMIKLKPVIMDGAEITSEIEDIIKQFDKTKTYLSGGNSFTGFTYSTYTANSIREQLEGLQKVKTASEKTVQEALQKFGEVPKEEGAVAVFDPMVASLQQLMDKLPEAQAALEALKKAETPDPKAIAEQERLIQNIKSQTAAREANLRVIREVETQIKSLQDDQKNYGKDDAEYKALEVRIKSLQAKLPKTKTSSSGGSTSKPKDYTDQLKREEQERIRFYKDIEFAVRQAEIDAMDEGLNKIIAQNKLNFEKEMEQVERQKQDKLAKIQEWERTIWESQNPDWEKKGLKFTPKTTQLSDDDNKQFQTIETGVKARFTADNNKAYEEALNEYAQFAQKYLDKVKEFNDNIKNLEKQGATTEAIEGVKSMQAEILAGLDEEMEIKEQTFVTFVEGMVGMGLEELLEALNKAKDALETEKSSGGNDKTKVNQLKAQVKTLTARINELTAVKDDTKEVKAGDPAKKWKDTLSVMSDVKTLTNNIADSFEGLDDATKAVLDAAMNIATGVINMIIGINTLAVGSAAATTATATTAAEAIKGVEKASVILAIISAALQIAQAIASVITNIFSNDKKKEKEIQRLQVQVDALKDAYDKLGKSIDKAYSTTAANLIEQQDENLRQQKVLLEKQIKAEEDKKKTDKNKVQQYKDAIKEIDNALEETHDRVIEAIIGQDISSAIDEFAEAYIDAWAAGEDKAASMKEVVRNMIKSAITELVKSRMSGEVEAFMDYLATAMEDGILTVAEQNTLDALEAAIYNKLNGLDASLDKYVKDNDVDEREASSTGFASMSQDSADELNGRFTALQALTYEICMSIRVLLSNSQSILLIVTGIKEDTKSLNRLEKIENDIESVKNSMNDIALKGITIKK